MKEVYAFMKLLNTIKTIAFWGICFLLILVIGFDVRLQDVFSTAVSLEMNLAAFCIYLLASVILFPILEIISAASILKAGLSFGDVFAADIAPLLWTPYKGLDFRYSFTKKNSELDIKGHLHDIVICIKRIIEMALWWFIVIFGVYTVYHQSNNAIRPALDQKSFIEKAIIIGICLAVYFVLQLFSWIVVKILKKRGREEMQWTYSQSGTRAQRYYESHPERVPAGCRACGGPYPECRASCNLYDD